MNLFFPSYIYVHICICTCSTLFDAVCCSVFLLFFSVGCLRLLLLFQCYFVGWLYLVYVVLDKIYKFNFLVTHTRANKIWLLLYRNIKFSQKIRSFFLIIAYLCAWLAVAICAVQRVFGCFQTFIWYIFICELSRHVWYVY